MAAQLLLWVYLLISFSASPASGAVKPIGRLQLDSALQMAGKKGQGDVLIEDQRLPAGSWLDKQDTVGTRPKFGLLVVQIFSPRARATRVAAAARKGVVQLTPKLWTPEMFNSGVLVTAGGVNEKGCVLRVEKIICGAEGIVTEALWTQIDSVAVSDRSGAKTMATSLQALFPLELFNSGEDLEVHVVTNLGPKDFKFSAAELAGLH